MFGRIFVDLAKGGGVSDEIMIDATHLKAQRIAASLVRQKPDLLAARSLQRRAPLPALFLIAGWISDFTMARALLSSLLPSQGRCSPPLGISLRGALAERDIEADIPSKFNRKVRTFHDLALYRKRHSIENVFGKPKDRRRVQTDYDHGAQTFMSAIAIAAIVIVWIQSMRSKPSWNRCS